MLITNARRWGKPWQKPPANFSSALPPPLFFRLPFFFLYAPGVNKREAPSGYKNHIIHEAFHAIAGVSACVCVCCESPNQRLCIPQSPSNTSDSCCHDPRMVVVVWGGVAICLKRPMPKRGGGLSDLVQNSWESQCFCGGWVPRARYFPPFFLSIHTHRRLKGTFSFKRTPEYKFTYSFLDRRVAPTPDELLMLAPALSHVALT